MTTRGSSKTARQRRERALAQQQLAALDAHVRRQQSRAGTAITHEQAVGWARKRYRQARQLAPGTPWEAAMTPELQSCLRSSLSQKKAELE